MIKQIKNLKGIILGIFLLLSFISVAKVKVNIDGTVNIDFGKSRDRDRNGNGNNYWDNNYDNGYNSVGDITDSQYLLKPFVLNRKGYSVLKQNGQLYILQVEFRNGNVNRAEKETIYDTKIFSSNCLAINRDNRYCLTITVEGSPALWDRQQGRIKYVGRWLKPNTYYDYNYDYDYYNNNQHWFEW
jgi:hypothetical protein